MHTKLEHEGKVMTVLEKAMHILENKAFQAGSFNRFPLSFPLHPAVNHLRPTLLRPPCFFSPPLLSLPFLPLSDY